MGRAAARQSDADSAGDADVSEDDQPEQPGGDATRATTADGGTIEDPALLAVLARLPPTAQVVVFSPAAGDWPVSLVSSLSVREYPTTLVSPSLARGDSLGAAVASTERTARLQRAELSGATVIDWDLDSPIDVALRASLADLFSVYNGRHDLASDPDALDQPRHRHRRDGAAGRRTAGNRSAAGPRSSGATPVPAGLRCGERRDRWQAVGTVWPASLRYRCRRLSLATGGTVVSLGAELFPVTSRAGVRPAVVTLLSQVIVVLGRLTAVFGATAATRGVVDTERVGTYGGVVVRTTAVPSLLPSYCSRGGLSTSRSPTPERRASSN